MSKVHYTELLPHEFRERLARRPLAYLPLGTLEWHGEHMPFGADALQSEGLFRICAERLGGIVLPPLFLGPDRAVPTPGGWLYGMDNGTPPRQLDGSCYWVPGGLFELMIDALLAQLKRAGFKAVFADGHGPSRWAWVDRLAEREERFGLKLFGVTAELQERWKSQMDHAGENETSLMMALRPDLVKLERLDPAPEVWPLGVGGGDPRGASAERGRDYLEASAEVVAEVLAEAGL